MIDFRKSLSALDRSRARFGRCPTNLGRNWHKWGINWPCSTRLGRCPTSVGRAWPNSDQTWSMSNQILPIPGKLWSDSTQHRPMSTGFCPISPERGPASANIVLILIPIGLPIQECALVLERQAPKAIESYSRRLGSAARAASGDELGPHMSWTFQDAIELNSTPGEAGNARPPVWHPLGEAPPKTVRSRAQIVQFPGPNSRAGRLRTHHALLLHPDVRTDQHLRNERRRWSTLA